MNAIKYRPEIDGLRSIAIISVILFHFNIKLLPGGFMGVDIFFVISGFLITSSILNEFEREHGIFSFSNFYLRKIRRILPVLILMVLITLLVGKTALYSSDVNILGEQGLASLLLFSNISHWLMAGNYWGQAAVNSPFLHTWYLSAEEQFYFFYPLFLVITARYFHKWLILAIFSLNLISVILFFYGIHNFPSAAFYLPPTRAWELGTGSLLATVLLKGNLKNTFYNFSFFKKIPNTVISSIFASLGLLMILFSCISAVGKDGISPFLVIPVLGTSLVVFFTINDETIVKYILSFSPIVYVGKLSYSLYLWHWPILVLTKQLALKYNFVINYFYISAAILVISIASYHLIEIPIRKNMKSTPYILAILLICVAFSYFLKVSDYSEDITLYNPTEWYGDLYNTNPHQEWPENVKKRMAGINISRYDDIDVNAFKKGGIINLYGRNLPEILVIGDSHGLMWGKVLDDLAKELAISISFYSADGIPAFFAIPPKRNSEGYTFFNAAEKYEFDKKRLKYIKEWKPKVVVIACKWSISSSIQEVSDLIEFIGRQGSKILLLEQPPELYFGDKNAPRYLSYLGLKPSGNLKQYVRYVENINYKMGIQLVKRLSDKYRFCQRVATSDLFLKDGKVLVIDSNSILYIDDDHLSYSGSLKAKERIKTALLEIFSKKHK